MDSSIEIAIEKLGVWHASLRRYQDDLPAKGTIAAVLVVLDRLRSDFILNIDSHVAPGGTQIAGLSAASLEKVLKEHGETRTLSAVAGRSNRGAKSEIESFLELVKLLCLAEVEFSERDEVLLAMQRHIVSNYVSLYFSVKRVKANFDQSETTRTFVNGILGNASRSGKGGPVAEHLVGAKLALCFPDLSVRNKPFSAADQQQGCVGDFELGDTSIHVTVAPSRELWEKCRDNLRAGKRVYVIVRQSILEGARQIAKLETNDRVAVEPVESFIATNLDEYAKFDGELLKSGLRRLLEVYNERVDAVEHDKSLMIEIPPNL